MRPVYIAGIGMTAFGKFPDTTVRTLAGEAAKAAMSDASLPPTAVGAVYFANAVGGLMTGQEMVRGQVWLRETGLLGAPIVNVENACASASTAVHLATMAVGSGSVETALAVGAEKLTHPDKARAFEAMATAVDLEQLPDLKATLYGGQDPPEGARSFFMDLYARMARAYMDRTGATARHFAEVSVKSHSHAVHNQRAQYRSLVTVEEVLASRIIADPLTLLMCAPIGDGAAAVLVCSEDVAKRLRCPAVRVRASVLVSGRDGDGPTAAQRASMSAYHQAGIGPEDIDVVELHDAAAPAELILYEELGLCSLGEGPRLIESGETTLGGRLPVNPSGGLLSRGHPVGATGCAQLVELTEQLRGQAGARQVSDARVALAENGGGYLGSDHAAVCVTVLVRD